MYTGSTDDNGNIVLVSQNSDQRILLTEINTYSLMGGHCMVDVVFKDDNGNEFVVSNDNMHFKKEHDISITESGVGYIGKSGGKRVDATYHFPDELYQLMNIFGTVIGLYYLYCE